MLDTLWDAFYVPGLRKSGSSNAAVPEGLLASGWPASFCSGGPPPRQHRTEHHPTPESEDKDDWFGLAEDAAYAPDAHSGTGRCAPFLAGFGVNIMDIAIQGKNLDVGTSLRDHVERQVDSVVTKYFSRAHNANITITKDANRFRVTITVHPKTGLVVQGHGSAHDAYAAFDSALERIAKQVRRYKRRLNDHHRDRGDDGSIPAQHYVIAAEAGDDELPEESQPAVIAEMVTSIETLTVSEAVMRMDLADLPAFMFRNRGHGRLNVVFRRPDGNIGWIDPQNAQMA